MKKEDIAYRGVVVILGILKSLINYHIATLSPDMEARKKFLEELLESSVTPMLKVVHIFEKTGGEETSLKEEADGE